MKIIKLTGVLLLALLSACDRSDAIVQIPPKSGFIWAAPTFIPINDYDYQKDEFFFRGTANSYVNVSPVSSDGNWMVSPSGTTADYKSRMIVYRPSNAEDFNGTVIVEWLNVSSGVETPTEWIMLHTELLRRGYAWVGISAQAVGLEGGEIPLPNPVPLALCLSAKCVSPLRYRSLSHPGDSFSYDIFRQAAQLIRNPAADAIRPLGPLQVERMIAAGQSQSAHRLVTFANAFGLYTSVFDGYFIHSRLGDNLPELGGAAAPLSEAPQVDISMPDVVMVRDDLSVPVMILQTEGDLLVFGSYSSRQEDTPLIRTWEIAGAAHADRYVSGTGLSDSGNNLAAARVVLTRRSNPLLSSCPENVNSGPQHHFIAKAAMSALNTWIQDGVPPPAFSPIVVNANADGFELDQYGNALGGVRSPYLDAPLFRLSGLNNAPRDGNNLCFMFGNTERLDGATREMLYGDLDGYVAAVRAAANAAVSKGALLPEDAELIIRAAEEETFGQE